MLIPEGEVSNSVKINLYPYARYSLMECKDIEWSAFLFNAMGEDWAYIDQVIEVKKDIEEKGLVGAAILNFLNRWSSRRKGEIKDTIDAWYKRNQSKLDELSFSLIKADFDDENNAGKIKDIYNSLLSPKGNGIGDTSASKTLHILKPDLFVAWDGPIKSWYDSQLDREDYKTMNAAEKYLAFLKKMQADAQYLRQQNEDLLDDLNAKVRRLYEGNLDRERDIERVNNKSKSVKAPKNPDYKKKDYEVMVDFMKKPGKTWAKYLDEYNWITITKRVKITPVWHPD